MLEVKFGDHCFSSSIVAAVFTLHFFPLFYLNSTSENQGLCLGCAISRNQSNKETNNTSSSFWSISTTFMPLFSFHTNFMPLFSFYTSWNHKKIKGFLVLSGVIKWKQCPEVGWKRSWVKFVLLLTTLMPIFQLVFADMNIVF